MRASTTMIITSMLAFRTLYFGNIMLWGDENHDKPARTRTQIEFRTSITRPKPRNPPPIINHSPNASPQTTFIASLLRRKTTRYDDNFLLTTICRPSSAEKKNLPTFEHSPPSYAGSFSSRRGADFLLDAAVVPRSRARDMIGGPSVRALVSRSRECSLRTFLFHRYKIFIRSSCWSRKADWIYY